MIATSGVLGAMHDIAEALETDSYEPMPRERLPDRLARRIQLLIQGGARGAGDRLPAIGEMARRFGVGHQSVREALKKLETMGVVDIKHGSGVYVRAAGDARPMAHAASADDTSCKTLLELTRARLPLETQAALEAARNATAQQVREMRRVLALAAADTDDAMLNQHVIAFHQLVANASGNAVLTQLLDVLHERFGEQQRALIGITGSRAHDHEQHVSILEAIERHDESLACRRMEQHLQEVERALLRQQQLGGALGGS